MHFRKESEMNRNGFTAPGGRPLIKIHVLKLIHRLLQVQLLMLSCYGPFEKSRGHVNESIIGYHYLEWSSDVSVTCLSNFHALHLVIFSETEIQMISTFQLLLYYLIRCKKYC